MSNYRLSDPAYTNLLATQFNTLTPDNDLKWTAVEPSQGDWHFEAAEADLAFANSHQMEFWGHNLIYNEDQYTPSWVRSIDDPVQLRSAMETWIRTVVDHFKGRIHRWVVVNEPILPALTGGQTLFEKKLGPNWMDWCFQVAHQADPKAELWLNEYGTEWLPGGVQAYANLVNGMKARKIPVYGASIKLHLLGYGTLYRDRLLQQMKLFAAQGVKTAFTEVDVPLTPPQDSTLFQRQADTYARIMSTCLTTKNCQEVTTWGLDDAHTWLDHQSWVRSPSTPLMFDNNLAPKPAFTSVQSCLARAAMKATRRAGKLPACLGW